MKTEKLCAGTYTVTLNNGNVYSLLCVRGKWCASNKTKSGRFPIDGKTMKEVLAKLESVEAGATFDPRIGKLCREGKNVFYKTVGGYVEGTLEEVEDALAAPAAAEKSHGERALDIMRAAGADIPADAKPAFLPMGQAPEAAPADSPAIKPQAAVAPYYERPCAAAPLKSYRYRGPFGFVMAGAMNDQDAMQEVRRSVSSVAVEFAKLEAWDGTKYVPVAPASPADEARERHKEKALHKAAKALNDSHWKTGAGFYVDFASGGCRRCYKARVKAGKLEVLEIGQVEAADWHELDPEIDKVRDGYGSRYINLNN